MAKLKAKYDLYCTLIKKHQDKHGFVLSEDCDSLLFSGLLGSIKGFPVDLEAAKDPKSNQWFRRPLDLPECFKCGHSKSTISRDMLLGALYHFYFNKRLDLITQVMDYAIKNYMIMGQAVDKKMLFGRCFMTPGLLSTYAWAYYRLGGKGPKALLRFIPNAESDSLEGFQAHLMVLHILLRGHLKGVKGYRWAICSTYAEKEPNNFLYQFAAGNFDKAWVILNDAKLFPNNRLPTSLDRKSEYLWQRSPGPDWKPDLAGREKEHSGLDFILAYALYYRMLV